MSRNFNGDLSDAELSKELSKAATREMLKPYKYQIEQIGLNYQKIKELIKKEILSDKVTDIDDEYHNFSQGELWLKAEEIDELIENGIIQGVGISPATCARFFKCQTINRNAFKIFCQTLQLDYNVVVYRPEIANEVVSINLKQQKLKQALGKFNHRLQWTRFEQFASRTAYLPIYIINPFLQPFFSKLLLNCLIENLSPSNSKSCVFYFREFKKVSSSQKRGRYYNLSDLLWTQLGEKLKPFNNSLNTIKVNKNSPAADLIRATASFLRQNNVILIIEPIDNIGNDTIAQIIQQFWQPLVQGISDELGRNYYSLLLCYIDKGNSQITTIRDYEENWDGSQLIELNVADVFNKIDLFLWIQYLQVMPLLELRQNGTEEIHSKMKEIWGCDRTSCDALTDLQSRFLVCSSCNTQEVRPGAFGDLLKAIYKKCHCEWDEDWETW